MKLVLVVLITVCVHFCFGQFAKIGGKIIDEDSLEMPFAKIVLTHESGETYRSISDMDGSFSSFDLKPGVYDLAVKAIGRDTFWVKEIYVKEDELVNVGTLMLEEANLIICGGCCWPTPIEINNDLKLATKKRFILEKDIVHYRAGRTIQEILGDELNRRRVRPAHELDALSQKESQTYFMDGGKINNLVHLQTNSISIIEIYNSHIPANFGDVTGEVISIQTKSYFDLYYNWNNGW